ncbi:MAG: DUF1573 domain-containing protein [FCB group bacterium]|nr:DUF1573 domain-containing protein [FCB group bacterium]
MTSKYCFSILAALSILLLFAIGGCGKDPVSSQDDIQTINGDSHVFFGAEATDSIVSFDFGYTPQSSKISHIYWLHNTGDDSLNIVNINPG